MPSVLTPDELLAHPGIDVVVNLTVPRAHAPVTRSALEAGKHAYSEKPLALDTTDGSTLVALAAERGLRLGCAPDTFLGGGLQTCRALIDAGAIGTPLAANAFFLGAGPESWHPDPRMFYQRGAGPMFDMGPYYVTALVALLGPVRRVTGSARISRSRRLIGSQPLAGTWMDVEVPTHVAGVLEHEAGPVATLVVSFDVPATRYRFIEIHGTEGTLSVPDSEYLRRPGPGPSPRRRRLDRHPAEPRQCDPEPWARSRGHGARPAIGEGPSGLGRAGAARAGGHGGRARRGRDRRAPGHSATWVERPAPLPAGLPDDATGD